MIPKIIHYIWLGGKPLNALAKKCLASWKKYCPDYEIKLWTEENFDITQNKYCKQAYDAKKWAFASDYVRVWVLKEYGGIYFDTDVELIKPIDEFLNDSKAFVGMENNKFVATGVIACEKNCKWINNFYNLYNDISFVNEDGSLDLTPNPEKATEAIKLLYKDFDKKDKSQIINYPEITIYPADYFTPMNYWTRKIELTENSRAIHHFDASWKPTSVKIKNKIKNFIKKIIFYDKWRKK